MSDSVRMITKDQLDRALGATKTKPVSNHPTIQMQKIAKCRLNALLARHIATKGGVRP